MKGKHKIKRTKAMGIQQGITWKLSQLKKQGVLPQKDFDYLYRRSHELYGLASMAGKLEEIKEILDKALMDEKCKSPVL